MKILIIATNIGRTAPGIVFERLVKGLSNFHEVNLLVQDLDSSIDLSRLSKIVSSKKISVHPRLNKLAITLFHVNPLDCLWAWKSLREIKKNTVFEYDLVLSFLSFQHYCALIAGNYISKKYNIKHAVYSVDAIPAPIGWMNNDKYYSGLKKMMDYYLRSADAFFSSNPEMLSYQLTKFSPKKGLFTGVIYNPSYGDFNYLENTHQETYNFVFAGGIYGVRKVDYLLEAFEKLLQIYPNSKLVFIGTCLPLLSEANLKSETLNKIEIMPFTKDLSKYYTEAIALIDIDADLEDDVFLSSKMTNYLLINRTIISETGVNSPSRHLFKDIDSILQCEHDSQQICKAMKKAIEIKKSVTFEDRSEIIKVFNLENIIKKLNISLDHLVKG